MHIWLKPGAERQLEGLKKQGLLGDLRVETHGSGEKYIQIYENPVDPTAVVPNIPQDLVDKVTFRDYIYRGLRTEGVYCHQGAVLMVQTRTGKTECYQEINVSAPDVDGLKTIYAMVRQRKLSPKENWEAEQTRPRAIWEKVLGILRRIKRAKAL